MRVTVARRWANGIIEGAEMLIWIIGFVCLLFVVAIIIGVINGKAQADERLKAASASPEAYLETLAALFPNGVPPRIKSSKAYQDACTASREASAAEYAAFDADTEKLTAKIDEVIQEHIRTLAKKYTQSVTLDDYGNHQFDKWHQEVAYFMNNVMPALVAQADGRDLSIESQITDAVHEYLASNPQAVVNIDSLNPIEFEHYCADMLRNDGWDARVTQASGDQGIDVIATFGNVKAVFQCKKYAQPVGNGAVQEIAAGKQHEQADIAAVVTNATFTPSAKQLAGTTGVLLLHYSELQGFAERLGIA